MGLSDKVQEEEESDGERKIILFWETFVNEEEEESRQGRERPGILLSTVAS